MFRQFAIFLFSSVIAFLATVAQAETLKVNLELSESTAAYQQFSAALGKTLAAGHANAVLIESTSAEAAGTDLIVAVGMKAMELAIARSQAPVLGVMIPSAGYKTLLEKQPAPQRAIAVSAIYLDQPWERQLNFIQAALPGLTTIGLLYSPDIHITLPRLPPGMSLNAKTVSSDKTLFEALESILDSSDLLLVVPDSKIYSNSNVRNILLTSYRYKVPLIGVSQAYVNAGALGAIFATPEQLAAQTADVIVAFASNRRLPAPQYSVSYSIGLNQQVARSLGIKLEPPQTIRERMDKAAQESKE